MTTNIDRSIVRHEDEAVDPMTGEIIQVPENRASGKRVVDDNFRRDLPQFHGFANRVKEDMSPVEIFQIIKQDIAKVINYDGMPFVPLKEYAGRDIHVVGALVRGVHSFSSKKLLNEDGSGVRLEGYDKLLLKVTAMTNAKGSWVEAKTPDAPFLIMGTSAGQPFALFEQAARNGLTPGDWPEGNFMRFHVSQMGLATLLGPASEE